MTLRPPPPEPDTPPPRSPRPLRFNIPNRAYSTTRPDTRAQYLESLDRECTYVFVFSSGVVCIPGEAQPDGSRLHRMAVTPGVSWYVYVLQVERHNYLRFRRQRARLRHRLRHLLLVHAATELLGNPWWPWHRLGILVNVTMHSRRRMNVMTRTGKSFIHYATSKSHPFDHPQGCFLQVMSFGLFTLPGFCHTHGVGQK